MDRIERRSAVASLAFHGLLALVAVVPALALVPAPKQPEEVPAPDPVQRLVLAPTPLAPPPPLPALPAGTVAGWADAAPEPLPAEIVRPRNTEGAADQRSRADVDAGEAPVRLPARPADAAERAARLDGRAWSERELSAEEKRRHDAASFLEMLLLAEHRRDWHRHGRPKRGFELWVRLKVDARGRVVEAARINSTGSTPLDAAIDHWLRDQRSPVSLPSIAPGVWHVLGVKPW